MDTNKIEEIFLMDEKIRKYFLGIYPIDMVPDLTKTGSIIVVNLDPSFKSGSHWIVLCLREQSMVEYFDSLGKKPKINIVSNLFRNNQFCVYNINRIQDYNTNTCGLFCLFYSYYACRFCNMESIISCFDDNLKTNEKIVKTFTKNYLSSHNHHVNKINEI